MVESLRSRRKPTMPSQNISSVQIKIFQAFFGLGALCVFLYATRSLMFGGRTIPGAVAAVCVGTGVALLLDKRYWLVCPVLLVLGIGIPTVSISPGEIGCLALAAIYCFRVVVRRDSFSAMSPQVAILIPTMAWVWFLFCMNPAGLNRFGSDKIGLMFYLKMTAAFLATLILSSMSFDETDCKTLFRCIIVAALIRFFYNLAFGAVGGDATTIDYEEQVSRYYLESAGILFMVLFARFSIHEILFSMKLPVVLFLAAVTFLSGRRSSAGQLVFIPFFQAMLTRRHYSTVVLCSVFAAIGLLFVIAGDGTIYHLPASVKRPLAIIVPEYRAQGFEGYSDGFRKRMRRIAYDTIRESPWFGRKGFAMTREEAAWLDTHNERTFFEGMAYAGNWHNIWLSYAADLGIPAMILWGIFVLRSLRFCFKSAWTLPFSPYAKACYLFFAYQFLCEIAMSWFSSSAPTASVQIWTRFGLLIAIANGAKNQPRTMIA